MGGVGSEFVRRCSGIARVCESREGQKASVTSAGYPAHLVVGVEPGFESGSSVQYLASTWAWVQLVRVKEGVRKAMAWH